ncbi:MAG: hemolysin-type calcium-binding repeat family protein [Rhizobium sp.]|nr:hemolysin-type calcium-binding repeat family protein [Rhizobium sp.]
MVMLNPVSAIGAGTLVNLGTTNSVTVGKNVILAATSGSVIYGTGSNHEAIINGTLISQGITIFYANGAATGNSVTVGKTGEVFAFGGSGVAIACLGSSATVTNHGYVESSTYGLAFIGNGAATHSMVVNTGTIKAGTLAIFRDASNTTETIEVKNSGLIESAGTAYGYTNAGHNAKDIITNTGVMIGAVRLDNGADIYDGRKGRIDGDVFGGGDADILKGGKEGNTFYGDAGQDKLTGGLGGDILTGGADADQFIYLSAKDSTAKAAGQDTIIDFNQGQGDQINLKAIDADSRTGGNQKFDFIDDGPFHGHAGELRFKIVLDDTFIYGDTNGDKKADFVIKLDTAVELTAGDFIL